MKNILIMILLAFSVCITECYSQGGIVSAPILEAQVGTLNATQVSQTSIMTGMNSVVAALEKADREYKEAIVGR